jgi:hypothetical protein
MHQELIVIIKEYDCAFEEGFYNIEIVVENKGSSGDGDL